MALEDETTYGFSKADASELVQLIGGVDREHKEWHDIPGGSGALVMKSPGGGIAVRSGSTLGSAATCTRWDRSGSTLSASSSTYEVYNLSTTAVANSVFIVAIETNIGWVAVWEDC